MRKEFLDILDKLKESNIPLSKVEKELGFGNGYLGKIKKDENRNISQENFDKLFKYCEKEVVGVVENSLPKIEPTKKEVAENKSSVKKEDSKSLTAIEQQEKKIKEQETMLSHCGSIYKKKMEALLDSYKKELQSLLK